jgi:hypothetical protein
MGGSEAGLLAHIARVERVSFSPCTDRPSLPAQISDSLKEMNKVKQVAMQDLSLNMAESAAQALGSFQQKRSSAVYLKLDPASETLTGQAEEKVSMDSIKAHLKPVRARQLAAVFSWA